MKKIFHLQLNEGRQRAICNAKCPLAKEEVRHQGNFIRSNDDEIDDTVACQCEDFEDNEFCCGYFFGLATDMNGQIHFDCRYNKEHHTL